MVSRVATTRPRLYQGSLRSVRSAICARVLPAHQKLVSSSVLAASCVIVSATRSRAALAKTRRDGTGAHAMSTNLFQLVSGCRISGCFQHVRLTTLPAFTGLFAHSGEQVHTPNQHRVPVESVTPRGPRTSPAPPRRARSAPSRRRAGRHAGDQEVRVVQARIIGGRRRLVQQRPHPPPAHRDRHHLTRPRCPPYHIGRRPAKPVPQPVPRQPARKHRLLPRHRPLRHRVPECAGIPGYHQKKDKRDKNRYFRTDR